MVDWGRVAGLRAEIGAADFAEVLEMFLAEADEAVRRLAQARIDRPVEAELHALKGAALNLGLSDLAASCSEGEKSARLGAAIDTRRIIACYTSSREVLLSGLRQRFAA